MAITSRAIIGSSITPPDGYTARTAFVVPGTNKLRVERDEPVASIQNANPATGFDNLLTALETWFTSTQAPAQGLNPAQTINANINISSIELVNTAASIYNTPVYVFRVKGEVSYSVA